MRLQTNTAKRSAQWLKILPVFFLSAPFLQVNAQKRMMVGYVLDSITYGPVTNARITNTNTNKNTTSGSKGIFTLAASPDDLLFFTADGYHFRVRRYNMPPEDTIIIYMAALPHELAPVTVNAKGYTRYQGDSMQRRQKFLEDMVQPKRVMAKTAKSGAGMEINLDYFSKFQKSKRRAYQLFDEHEIDSYINYRFSKKTVAAYTGFKGDTLQQFINLYRPAYEWLRKNTTDEDVTYYIYDHVKLFYLRKENH